MVLDSRRSTAVSPRESRPIYSMRRYGNAFLVHSLSGYSALSLSKHALSALGLFVCLYVDTPRKKIASGAEPLWGCPLSNSSKTSIALSNRPAS